MEEKQNIKKVGFFEKLKIAVFKPEDYSSKLLGGKIWNCISYLLILLLLFAAIFSLAYSGKIYQEYNTAMNYINNELPEFTYKDQTLISESNVEAYDYDYQVRLFINTDENVDEDALLDEYSNKMYPTDMGIAVFRDGLSMIYYNSTEEKYYTLDYKYSTIEDMLDETIEFNSKQDALDYFNNMGGINSIVIAYTFSAFIASYISFFIEILFYILVVTIFGFFAGLIAKVVLDFKSLFKIAIYSVTLPTILYLMYLIANMYTSFYNSYVSVFFIVIGCVYLYGVIFMIKSDAIKEIKAVGEVQKVQEELKEQKEENQKDSETVNEESVKEENKEQEEIKPEVVEEIKDNNEEPKEEVKEEPKEETKEEKENISNDDNNSDEKKD